MRLSLQRWTARSSTTFVRSISWIPEREEEISKRLGPSHAQAVSLRAEMAQYQRLMFEELGRIADSYKNEYEVAQVREESLRNSLTSSVSVTSAANENSGHFARIAT